MKKYGIICFLLLITLAQKANSQGMNIILPKTENATDQIPKGNYLTFLINENHELYFEDTRIRFWDQIGSKILELKRTINSNYENKIVLFADKRIDYDLIGRLREEIGKVWHGTFYLKCNSFDNADAISFYISSSFLKNHYVPTDSPLYGQELIRTRKESEGVDKVPIIGNVVLPSLPSWQIEFIDDFYASNSKNIKSTLEDSNNATLVITPYSYCKIKNEEFRKENREALKSKIKSLDFVFLKVDPRVSFQEYIDFTSIISSTRVKEIGLVLKKPFIIEIPSFFEGKVKSMNLNILD